MRSMKKLIVFLISLVLIPLTVKADDKVKVYIFEAGGCPYCEDEKTYLRSLDSYNDLFTIEVKELYVDHVDWVQGEDYELGMKVAKAFQNAGYPDSIYKGTPYVVISDLYASSGYNPSLESVIKEAYENGDKDVVSCIANGNEGCLPEKVQKKASKKAIIVLGISIPVIIILLGGIYFLTTKSKKEKSQK